MNRFPFLISIIAACGFLLIPSASANPTVESTEVGNVTTTGFSLCWESSEAARPRLRVFLDAAGTQEITAEVAIVYQALTAHQREVASTPETRTRNREVRQVMTDRLVFLARVSGLQPGTDYWVEAAVLDPVDDSPDASALIPLTTASRATFLVESRQLVVDVGGAGDLTGCVVGLSHANSPYPLLAVVGDGLTGSRAYFDLSHFLDASGETQLSPASGTTLELVVTLKGADLGGGDFDGTDVAFDGSLTAALSSTATYSPGGVLLVATPTRATALVGQPLLVDFRAETASGDAVVGFNRPLTLTSAAIEGGSLVTGRLSDGILEGLPLTFISAGVQTVSVLDATTGSGTSFEVNVLDYTYDNFRTHYFGDPADPAGGFSINGDHDAYSNLEEFAYGLNPLILDRPLALGGDGASVVREGGPVITLRIDTSGVDFRVTFLRSRNHEGLGLSYVPRFSADLENWFDAPGDPTVLGTEGELELVTFRYPLLTPEIRKARFFSLAVKVQ